MERVDLRAARLMEETADLFESGKVEWIQGSLGNYIDRACLVGGLEIRGRNILSSAMRHIILQRAHDLLSEHTDGDLVAYWNDRSYRTKAEVIDLLKETAKDIRNQS